MSSNLRKLAKTLLAVPKQAPGGTGLRIARGVVVSSNIGQTVLTLDGGSTHVTAFNFVHAQQMPVGTVVECLVVGNKAFILGAYGAPDLSGTQGATVVTSQTTASTTYTNLATPGPAVTVLTGTRALVTVSAVISTSVALDASVMSYAVSGSTTIAASDNNGAQARTAQLVSASATSMVTGLTPGSNTFTAQYRVTAGTGTFVIRWITVIPLP
jgi:hypothetical protein